MEIEIKNITIEDLQKAYSLGKSDASDMFRDFVLDCSEDKDGNFIVDAETMADAEGDIDTQLKLLDGRLYDDLNQKT